MFYKGFTVKKLPLEEKTSKLGWRLKASVIKQMNDDAAAAGFGQYPGKYLEMVYSRLRTLVVAERGPTWTISQKRSVSLSEGGKSKTKRVPLESGGTRKKN